MRPRQFISSAYYSRLSASTELVPIPIYSMHAGRQHLQVQVQILARPRTRGEGGKKAGKTKRYHFVSFFAMVAQLFLPSLPYVVGTKSRATKERGVSQKRIKDEAPAGKIESSSCLFFRGLYSETVLLMKFGSCEFGGGRLVWGLMDWRVVEVDSVLDDVMSFLRSAGDSIWYGIAGEFDCVG